jgi:hypothetical protein
MDVLRLEAFGQRTEAGHIGKEHRDLLAFAGQRTAGGENFLGEVRGGVGQWRTVLRAVRKNSGRARRVGMTGPDEDPTVFIDCELLGLDELGFEILQNGVIKLELPLEGSIGDSFALAEENHDLIEERVKVHTSPSAAGGGVLGDGDGTGTTCTTYL